MELSLYGATTKQETLALVKDYAEANPELPIITGIGWSASVLGGFPTAADLDAIVPDHPVILIEFTSHEGWLNTAALNAANITADTPDLNPGTTYWMRDEQGNPTGVGIEAQWMEAYLALGLWDAEKMIRPSATKLMAIATKGGVTTAQMTGILTPTIPYHERSKTDFEAAMKVLQTMDDAGELNIRTFTMPVLKAKDADPVKFAQFAARMAEQYRSDRLGVKGVKIHPESIIFTKSSPFIEPYAGTTDHRGQFGVSPERTLLMTREANKHSLDLIIHVEGDASTRAGIDAFEQVKKEGFTDARNQLHHLTFTHKDDIQRIIDLNIAVNASPMFYNTFGQQHTLFNSLLGKARVNQSLGLYSDLAKRGVRVSISPDYPGVPATMLAPLFQIQAAVTLQDPSDPSSVPFPLSRQPMALDEALKAYTIDAAWFMRMEDKVGSVQVGKYADFVVLETDIRAVALQELKDVKVLGTMMGGRFTHREGL